MEDDKRLTGLKRAFSFVISPKTHRKLLERPNSPATHPRYIPSTALIGDQKVGKTRLLNRWKGTTEENHTYCSTMSPSIHYIPDKGYIWDMPSIIDKSTIDILKKCRVLIVTGVRMPMNWIEFCDTHDIAFNIIDRDGKLIEDDFY